MWEESQVDGRRGERKIGQNMFNFRCWKIARELVGGWMGRWPKQV